MVVVTIEKLIKAKAIQSIIKQLECQERSWERCFDLGTKDPEFYELEDNNERTIYLKMGEMRQLRSIINSYLKEID